MIIDCHVHVSACTPEHGEMSAFLQNTAAFRFMRWRLKVKGYDGNAEKQIADRLRTTLDQTPQLDAAVILAFDGVYDREGRQPGTHAPPCEKRLRGRTGHGSSENVVRSIGQPVPQRRGRGTRAVH